MEMAMLGGALVFMLVAVLVGLLFAGLVLKFSVRLIEGFAPGYWRAVLTVLAAGIAVFVVNLVVMTVLGVGSGMSSLGAQPDPAAVMAAMGGAMFASVAISLVAALVLNALCINWLIKHPGGRSIGFGRSTLIALLYLVAMFVVSFIIFIVLGVVLGLGAAGLAGSMG